MEELSQVLQKTIDFLEQSQPSMWSNLTLPEVIETIETELARIQAGKKLDKQLLKTLFAPTGAIQETSIENGWGDDFLILAGVVDKYL